MDKHTIINLKLQGHSNRVVAKITKFDRKTVSKYWEDYLNQLEKLKDSEANILEVQEKIIEAPKYDTSSRKARKYTEELDKRLDEILAEENNKNLKLGPNKQKLTKTQIHQILVNEGFDISFTTITRRINRKQNKAKECFIKQDYSLGYRLEYDFGEVKLIINGEPETYHLAVFSSPAGDFRWAYLYKNQKKDVFLDSHLRFFEMIGGVHKEVVYDNMKNVVTKFIGRNEKELNEDLVKLSLYYGFNINVTNCFSGNEKGHVEGSVKIIRNRAFALEYAFESLEQAEEHLNKILLEINKNSKIEDEKPYLIPVKPKLEVAHLTMNKVNKYSFIQVENNFYSVPEYMIGRTVTVKSYVDKIIVYSNNKTICEHKKIDGLSEISIDITHYLNSLLKKPGAIKNSLALKSIPKLKTIYDSYFNTNPKKFIEILTLHKEKSLDDILREFEKYTFASELIVPIDNLSTNHSIQKSTMKQLLKYNELSIRKGEIYVH
jgi:hypothetical protein